MIASILFFFRNASSTANGCGPAKSAGLATGANEPARESLFEHFNPRRQAGGSALPDLFRDLRGECEAEF